MRSTRCAFNTAATLHRALTPNLLHKDTALHIPKPTASRLCARTQVRRYAVGFVRRIGQNHGEDTPKRAKYKLGRLPRDDEISHPLVYVAGEAGTSLSEPISTKAVLSKIDRKTHSLTIVALPDPDNPEAPRYPVCRIINKLEAAQAQKERAKAQRKKVVQLKEVVINWAIDPHDLGHRLKRLRDFLEKGYTVEVTLEKPKKRNKRQATVDEAKEVLRRVKELVEEVPGAKESKKTEGKLLSSMKMFLEGQKATSGRDDPAVPDP